MEPKIIQVTAEDRSSPWRGTAISTGPVDIVIIDGWDEQWASYQEGVIFWRSNHYPEWECTKILAVLPDEMSSPLGWVKHFPKLVCLFEPLVRQPVISDEDARPPESLTPSA